MKALQEVERERERARERERENITDLFEEGHTLETQRRSAFLAASGILSGYRFWQRPRCKRPPEPTDC